jgi:hypothetical protein
MSITCGIDWSEAHHDGSGTWPAALPDQPAQPIT